ncbi:MAG: hypothetical protein J2O48_08525 [Solirubrobacterales bacterium]|nr:hypothetical protein [Solirubrobacterales bacterium]
MTLEQRRMARNAIPPFWALVLVVGLLVHQFVPVLIGASVVAGLLYSLIARSAAAEGGGRQRNRNRSRDRDRGA